MKVRKLGYSRYLSLFIFMLCNEAALANTTYTLDYAATSPVKEVSLKNAELTLETYQNAIPSGYSNVKTDQNQSFSIDQNTSFEIISIKGEEKYQARCYGTPSEGTTKIEITCEAKKP